MFLKNLAPVIYEKNTASANRLITVKDGVGKVLWHGKAKDLITFACNTNWLVLEVLVDWASLTEMDIPAYNKSKIIIVY